jgi:amino acid permease
VGHKHLSLQQSTCCNNICLLHDIARLFGTLSLCLQTTMHHVNIPRIKKKKKKKKKTRNLKNQKIIRINYHAFTRVFTFLG